MSEWISVEDRLPGDEGSHFDVYAEGRRIPDALYDSINEEFLEYRADIDGYYEWRIIEGVTHWRPLRQPPKDKQGDV